MDEPLAPVTRADFERFAAEIRGEIAAAVAASARASRHDVLSDILMQLRILRWVMGFGFVAIMGALGVLYQGQADLLAELRAESVRRLEVGQTFILGRLEEIAGTVRQLESMRGENVPAEMRATS